MAINKVYNSFKEAVADVKDGSIIFIGNFAGPGGTPFFLIKALRDQGAKNLTIVANTAGGIGLTLDYDDHRILFQNHQVKKVIASFPFSTSAKRPSDAEKQILAGEVELELVPQGTLAERIRAGGAGIAAFYTPTGPGTVIEEGKEKRYFNGQTLSHGIWLESRLCSGKSLESRYPGKLDFPRYPETVQSHYGHGRRYHHC